MQGEHSLVGAGGGGGHSGGGGGGGDGGGGHSGGGGGGGDGSGGHSGRGGGGGGGKGRHGFSQESHILHATPSLETVVTSVGNVAIIRGMLMKVKRVKNIGAKLGIAMKE